MFTATGQCKADELGRGLATLLSGLDQEVDDIRALLPLRGVGIGHADLLQRLEMQICAAGNNSLSLHAAPTLCQHPDLFHTLLEDRGRRISLPRRAHPGG